MEIESFKYSDSRRLFTIIPTFRRYPVNTIIATTEDRVGPTGWLLVRRRFLGGIRFFRRRFFIGSAVGSARRERNILTVH